MATVTKQELGKRLGVLRRRVKLTQAEVAEKLKIAPETLSRIERGEQWTDFETFVALARIYKVEFSELMALSSGGRSGKKALVQDLVDLVSPATKNQIELIMDLARVVVEKK